MSLNILSPGHRSAASQSVSRSYAGATVPCISTRFPILISLVRKFPGLQARAGTNRVKIAIVVEKRFLGFSLNSQTSIAPVLHC
jgi:hypothetical protein